MRPLEEAQAEVLDAMAALEAAETSLWEASGLVLAEDVTAEVNVPPFANSAVDGYAVRAADVAETPVTLEVVEDVPAGHVAKRTVDEMTAIRIMTGAPVPDGADTVIRVEDTRAGVGTVEILIGAGQGTAVRPMGGDVPRGTTVFEAGTVLTPPHLGVLSAIGVANPRVVRRPRVAILSTGDEVRPPETAALDPGQIRDANRPLLTGLLGELGVEIRDLGIVPDQATALRSTLLEAAETCDAILTSGGVSMGDYDLVKQILTELGGVELWKVAMQPAKPFAFGAIGGTPLFGLPGNPVSVMVAFEQFARPALLTMMGHRFVFRPRITGVAGERLDTDPEKTVFLRVVVDETGERPVARLAGGQASNVLSAAALADAFAVVPRGTDVVAEGDPVTLELFRRPPTRSREEALDDR